MKKVIYIFLASLFFCPSIFSKPFQHDRAVRAAQKGNFKKAYKMLSALSTNYPDDPELLYDTGVAAFQQKKFKEAVAYFKNSAKNKTASDQLKQDAYFNWGNTVVELKKLEDAIKQYENVLNINPEHQQAKHNLEIVKKMLEQQQNDQQENKDKKNSDEQQSDKQKNDQRNHDQSDKQDQKEQGQQDREEKKDQQADKNKEPETKDDRSNDSQSEKDKQEQKDESKHDQPSEDNQQEQSSEDKRKEQKEQSEQQENKGSGPANQQPNQYDQQVMQILEFMEQKEAEAQKRMMAAQIQKATGDHDANQNNY